MQIRGVHLGARVETSGDADLETARAFLRSNRALLRLEQPDQELLLSARQKDELGYRHLKFEQRYRGLSVWPAEMIVHLDSGGDVCLLDGAYVPTPTKLLTDPIVDLEAAIRYARRAVPGGEKAETSARELIVYAPGTRPPRLAWKLELTVSPISRWLVVVDALNGTRLTAFNQVMTQAAAASGRDLFGRTQTLNVWNEAGTYYMVNASKQMFDPTSRPPRIENARGTITVLDDRNAPADSNGNYPNLFYVTTSNPNSWTPPDAVSAAVGLSQTYDYYLERHGRNSFDGQGGNVISIVRVDRNMDNAFWNGTAIFFGDAKPYAGALDIAGHELTHGVIQKTANLIYQNQPGALNEAMSDIFGQAVEARIEGQADWLHGDVFPRPDRNMRDPASLEIDNSGRRYPSRMSEYISENDPFLDRFDGKDNGGVHLNSGIINRAFYLLAEGLSGAIGLPDAERIFYRALTTHLLRNSQFLDARLACIQSAAELFGAGSAQAGKTAEAFDQVEIFDATGSPPPPTAPPVNAPDSALFVYFDTQGNGLFLGRRESALGDPTAGINLGQSRAASARPSVTGDGTLAFFVNSARDACFIATNAGPGALPSCLGLPGQISSVAMSPNRRLYGFVLLNFSGRPDNRIAIVDLGTNATTSYRLASPTLDGGAPPAVLFADVMNFTANGRYLIYDALTALQLADGSRIGLWSIYAIDFSTLQTLTLLPPTPGIDIANPSLGHTNDNLLTFEAADQQSGQSLVLAGNLQTGALRGVVLLPTGPAAPAYTGNDSAIVFTFPAQNPTGSSLGQQPLGADHITPVGPPVRWLEDAEFGVTYRRGLYFGPAPNCTASDTALCLNNGRFQVRVSWSTPQGQTGQGHAVGLTVDTGYFWFFSSANVEVVIKVLNACGISQRFWMFAGGLTNVASIITVTDTVTGVVRTYSSRQGTSFQPIQDTNAFPTCFAASASGALSAGDRAFLASSTMEEVESFLSGPAPVSSQASELSEVPAHVRSEPFAGENSAPSKLSLKAPAQTCVPGPTALCLNNGRFKVETSYRTPQGISGNGTAVGLTGDTGYFWFFGPANIEVMAKVLNACSLAGRHWVFAAGLTNAEVTLRVTDTLTGEVEVKEYRNPLNTPFAPIQDTSAFSRCP